MDSVSPNSGNAKKDKRADLISAINAATATTVIMDLVKKDTSLIDTEDDQKNTPLHYAVAQHNLKLIKWLIEQGADTTAKNRHGETAGEWFKPFFASVYGINQDKLESLEQVIQCNATQFVASLLAGGISPDLRFLQAKTLLHFAVNYQQLAIVKLLLEGKSRGAVEKLLDLRDSQGVTPLMLAQQRCRQGSPVAQEIMNYLQEKQRPVAEGGGELVFPTRCLLSTFLFKQIDAGVEQRELNALETLFSHCYGPPDVVKLNPWRSTIVKLAYNLCYQAQLHFKGSTPIMVSRCSGRAGFPIEDLFKNLFGAWMSRGQQIFEKKLSLLLLNLSSLLKQNQVEQVIEFSEEKSHTQGWVAFNSPKIYLNHRLKGGLISVVATLIHEATHRTDHSYDFFSTKYSKSIEGFSISLDPAYQLAAKGTAGELTAAERQLFEVRLLLEKGYHDDWEQNLRHWMALHSAETLTIAILALAAIPTGFARYDSQPKPALVIEPRFLQTLCGVATHRNPAMPERALGCEKRYKVSSLALPDREARPGTADSGFSSYAGSSTASEAASPPPLAQSMAAGMPDAAMLTLSPEVPQAGESRRSSSSAFTNSQHVLKNCNPS